MNGEKIHAIVWRLPSTILLFCWVVGLGLKVFPLDKAGCSLVLDCYCVNKDGSAGKMN